MVNAREVTVVIDGEVAIMRPGNDKGGHGGESWTGAARDTDGNRLLAAAAAELVDNGAVMGYTDDGDGIMVGDVGDIIDAGSEPLPNVTEFLTEGFEDEGPPESEDEDEDEDEEPTEDESPAEKEEGEQVTTATATKSKANQKAQQNARTKAEKPKAAPKPKAERTLNECACGCGGETYGTFAIGHDSKLRSLINKVQDGIEPKSKIPAIAKRVLADCPTCGMPDVHGHRHEAKEKRAKPAKSE